MDVVIYTYSALGLFLPFESEGKNNQKVIPMLQVKLIASRKII